MDAYVWAADVWCPDCAAKVRDTLRTAGRTDTGDSGDWPQGPYPNGGGEADTPHHCPGCGVFLENPLTADGIEYVREAAASGPRGGVARTVWAACYGIDLTPAAE